MIKFLNPNQMRNRGLWISLLIGFLSIISARMAAQQAVPISNQTLNTCNARITDDGGPNGNYSDTDYTMTLCADPGTELFIVINTLNLSENNRGQKDLFRIFEGNTTTGTVVFNSNNNGPIGNILRVNNGCITLSLQAQEIGAFGVNGSGFDLEVTCTLPETCADGLLNNGEVLIDCGGPNCAPCFNTQDCSANVVFNGDFEMDNTPVCTAAPNGPFGETNQIPRIWYNQTPVSGWLGTANRTDGRSFPTADYFRNSCTNTSSRSCMSGNGSVGYWAHFFGNENPEYIQTQLTEPLIAGREYCISVVAETGQSDRSNLPDSDKLGFWFHNNTYSSGDGFVNIDNDNNGQTFLGPGSTVNAQPQVINSPGQMISKPCKTFNYSFCAQGGEQYLIVGNFVPGRSASGSEEYITIDNLVIKPSCPLDFDLTILGPTDCDARAFEITAQTSNQQGGCIFSNDFTYQWLLNGAALPGQTNPTLTNISADMDRVYSVQVTYNAGCSSLTKTSVYPGPGQSNNAGSDSTLTLCTLDSSIDLFSILGGQPEAGGTWSPALGSGTGVFDPNVDAPGAYTYTLMGSAPCPDASATITLEVGSMRGAGENGSLRICNTAAPVDLFGILGGTPNTGGVWSPALGSGTGVFDPAVDAPGTYTYTLAGSELCPESSAQVTVELSGAPDAGENGSLRICNTAAPVDLLLSLGGTPSTGGVWSPALGSGTGVFDPAVDAPGTYTYTLNSANCPSESSQVAVLVGMNPSADAGNDVETCLDGVRLSASGGRGQWSCTAGTLDLPSNPEASLSGLVENTTTTCTWRVTDEICGDATSQVQINRVGTMTDPALTFQGQEVTQEIIHLCQDQTNLALSAAEPTPTETGSWMIRQGSSIGLNNPLTQANQGNVSIQGLGLTVLTYTIRTSVPGCPEVTDQLEIEVHPIPVAEIRVDLEICEGEDLLVQTAPIQQNDIGTWTSQLQPTPLVPPLSWVLLNGRLEVGQNQITYSVANEGCAPQSSNATITVLDKESAVCTQPQKEKLMAPNVFTPNGDGDNDMFVIKGIGAYPNAKVAIFNRWGTKVYQSEDYFNHPWDGGTFPDGVYYYVVELEPNADQGTGHSGVIHVVR